MKLYCSQCQRNSNYKMSFILFRAKCKTCGKVIDFTQYRALVIFKIVYIIFLLILVQIIVYLLDLYFTIFTSLLLKYIIATIFIGIIFIPLHTVINFLLYKKLYNK